MEGDIKACFDEISHPALMDRMRRRVGDRRVLDLVKAFLKSGVLGEDKEMKKTTTGTPQGSILSPLLSNVALSVLDDSVAEQPGGPRSTTTGRAKRRRHGLANYRLGPVCGRLVPGNQRHQGRRRGPARADRAGSVDDGVAPFAGENPDHPHR